MALTKIGSIGINTGIAFAGVTTIVTLNASDDVLSVGGTVNFVSDVSIGGTVSIAGTLTYEDVTNVDAVGLITARDGIKVGSGITLSVDGDGFFTGVITATSYSGIDLSDVTGATGDFSIADKIVHTGDTDTAIRFSGADTITAETGGSSRFKIDSSGNVTIGNDGDSGSNPSSGYDELCIEGGNEAIGMCFLSPAANNVEQTIAFGDSNNNQSGKIQYEHANDAMHFDTAGSERLRIDSNGNVSVGNNPTVASDTLFHVEKSGETNVQFEGDTSTLGARLTLKNNNTGAGAKNQIDFADAGGQSTSSIQGYNTDQTNNYGYLTFNTRSVQGTPPEERMRIHSAGNVTMDDQACMVFTNAVNVTSPSEDTPLQFSGLDVSKGGMTESNSRSRITVPTAGVYLIHAMIAGSVVTAASSDGVELHLRKNGSRFPGEESFPISTYGTGAGDEYYFDFTIMLSLSANDYLEVSLTNIDSSQGNISRGVFCVTLLH